MSREKVVSEEERKSLSKKFRKPIFTIIFILINVLVIALTAFNEFGNSENASGLSEVRFNFWFLVPAGLCFFIAIVLEIYKYVLMMRRAGHKKINLKIWSVARRTVLLGKYYDSITPAAIGGQPFQIYYMHKNAGLSTGMATTIPIIGMVSNQLGFLIIAVLAVFGGGFLINNSTLVATACLGLLVFAFWPIMIMIATFLPKTTMEIISLIVKLLAKLRIVKNKNEAIKKAKNGVGEYAECVKIILKTKRLFAETIIIAVLFNALVSSIPFFVLTAFGGNVDFMTCFVTTIAVTSAVYFIPTPGNAGAAEGTFYLVFSGLASGSTFWAMLVWRFFSYYIYIILGPIIYLRMHLEKKRKKGV